MKSRSFSVCIFAAVFLLMSDAKADEPAKVAAPAVDSMLGKEPGQVRDDNGLKMKLVWCPSGEFTMGSPKSETGRKDDEGPIETTLTRGFWIGKFEVTQSEWKRIMATEPFNQRNTRRVLGDDIAETHVNRDDATDFCRELTERERKSGRISAAWAYTLPSEAQWEYACRGGTKTKFNYGDDESKLDEYAWFYDNAGKVGERYAHEVGQKKANTWGLHDMAGNIWEWCSDSYHVKLPGGRDPDVRNAESFGVIRGGCWSCRSDDCRSADRFEFNTTRRESHLGLRVALSPSQ